MGGEKPQFKEVQAKTQPYEIQLALLQDAGAATQAFDAKPLDKTPPKEITAADGTKKMAYSPGNPPEPNHTIDKKEIQSIGSGKSAWQCTGQIDGDKDTECQVTYYWKTGRTKPQQIETTYTNNSPGAKQLGKDITFIEANPSVGLNTKIDIRTATNNPDRPGCDCVIESYPIKASDGSSDYLVHINKAFVGIGGLLEKRTVENVNGKKHEYFYSARVKRYAGLDKDKKTPTDLKTDTLYVDEDGGTSQKLQEDKYVDGKPTTTIVFDPNAPKETAARTVTHTQFNGATSKSKVVDHNHLAPDCELITDVNPADQQYLKITYNNPDKQPIFTMDRKPKTETKLETVTLKLNNTVDLDPGPGVQPGSALIIFKTGSDGEQYIDYLETKEGTRKIMELKPPAGELKLKYNESGQVVGVEGATFFEHGNPVDAAKLEKMFIGNEKINSLWQDALKNPTR